MPRVPRSLLLALSLSLFVLLAACGDGAALSGTELNAEPAPGFTLTDQRGQPVRLSDLRGSAVALTFIYTNCPDICPLIAQRLRLAYEHLPAATRTKVAMIAVTVDPERDTQQTLRDFSEKHGLAENPRWYALTGERATLEAVWAAYFISPGSMAKPGHQPHGDEHEQEHGVNAGTGTPSPEELLAHTDAIYLIDPKGDRRLLMRSDADAKDIASNLQALAR